MLELRHHAAFKIAVLLLSIAIVASGCSSPRKRAADPDAVTAPMVVSDLDGKPFDIGAVLDGGETVALVFWRPNCAACRNEADALAAAARENDGSVRFFGVVAGRERIFDSASIRKTSNDWGLGYPSLRDGDLSLMNLLGVSMTPTIVIIDPTRTVRYQSHRPPTNWTAYTD